jgi:hypothetical protein
MPNLNDLLDVSGNHLLAIAQRKIVKIAQS